MARSSQVVQVGKRKIELSNLDKVLWPEDHVVKAELIQYYLAIAPTILAHIHGRPLSLVRFPDGIHGDTFFQKNLPDWTPDWIESVEIGDEKKTIKYFVPTEEASLVWLANLACIELHQMHCRVRHRDHPDYFVFDVDPPDGTPWQDIADTGALLREEIEKYGYHTFVKTTGRKGLHVVAPIEPRWDFETVFRATEAIAKPLVARHAKTLTLRIHKEQRDNKILIDIYRNRPSQTIVSAYSARGLPGATVSMPLTWDRLHTIEGVRAFTVRNVPDIVKREGDPWQGMNAFAVELHTHRSAPKPAKQLPRNAKHKTPEQLDTYAKKREFSKTPEPAPQPVEEGTNRFVVHRHHASRLHYDLRLEMDGVLRSYAVPKGLPPRPGIKRLAVQTEDHPIEYLQFEGTIPKGEYGGGDMWVYASGRYEVTKAKKDSTYVRLNSRGLTGEFRIIPTRGRENLLERVDTPQTDWLVEPVEPMLAELSTKIPAGDWIYEVKWDGIRAMIALDEGVVRIRSRNQNDITAAFPELTTADAAFRATCGLFDCEIVCLDAAGRPVFKDVINRMRQTSEGAIARAKAKHPAVCYVFDCLYLDGRPLVNEPIERRREWMADAIKKDSAYRVSQAVEDGEALFDAAAEAGLEGIMAKRAGSVYVPGRRNDAWQKIKTRRTLDCVIVGYTRGKGDRGALFGALQIAERAADGSLTYLGKVGTGFDAKTLEAVHAEVSKLPPVKRPIAEKPLDDRETTWVSPTLWCEVQYASLTPNGTLREPVFVRMRPDIGG